MHVSFNQAVNSTFCHSISLSTSFDIPDELTAHADELDEPIATLIVRRAGSIKTYCQSLRRPLVNNENSLMLLMRTILLADADVSAAGIGRTLSAARLLIVLVLCVALFSAGASVFTGVSETLRLSGIAEDRTPGGVVRTAIISGRGQLFLAKQGDAVTDRYQVARISSEVVELTDLTDGSLVRLALK